MRRGFGFGHAFRGLGEAISADRNVRTQITAAVTVIAAGLYVKLDRTSWVPVILCIGLVLGLELINTALEALCDRVTVERDDAIRRCKDIAASGVLVGVLTSAAVAVFVFARSELWRDKPWPVTLALAGLLAVGGSFFIFLGGRRGL